MDLKLLNVLFIRESLPGGKLEDRNSEFQTHCICSRDLKMMTTPFIKRSKCNIN